MKIGLKFLMFQIFTSLENPTDDGFIQLGIHSVNANVISRIYFATIIERETCLDPLLKTPKISRFEGSITSRFGLFSTSIPSLI